MTYPERNAGEALAVFMSAIERSCEPMTLEPESREAVRALLQADFEREFTLGTWPAARPKMLRIARYVGVVAALSTEARSFREAPTSRATPDQVNGEFLKVSSEIVKTLLCPRAPGGVEPSDTGVESSATMTGRFCTGAAFAPDLTGPLAAVLGQSLLFRETPK